MKKVLLTIGFTLAGIFTSLAQAQIVTLTLDPAQSSSDVTVNGVLNTSTVSGTITIDLQDLAPPSGSAQITQLDVEVDQMLDFDLGLLAASIAPGDFAISLVDPGAPGTISGSSFDQLANTVELEGDLILTNTIVTNLSSTTDISTIPVPAFDFDSVNVTQSGNNVSISGSFTITQELDLGLGAATIVVETTYVATGVAPAAVLLGDVSMDGVVNFLDIPGFIQTLISGVFKAEADVDESGVVNFLDIPRFIAILMRL